MENINSTIDFVQKNVRPGFVFKCGEDSYTVHKITDSFVTIIYFGLKKKIPMELFYEVIQKHNLLC